MNQLSIPTAAKAYVALIGSIATALLGVFTADTAVGKVLTIVVVIATAVGTWAVPNVPPTRGGARMKQRNEFGYYAGGPINLLIVVILVVILLIVLLKLLGAL